MTDQRLALSWIKRADVQLLRTDFRRLRGQHFGKGDTGRLHVVMNDGSEAEFGPGKVSLLPPGHGAWVVGDEPVVVLAISGMVDHARQA
jgi:hypothetical protein